MSEKLQQYIGVKIVMAAPMTREMFHHKKDGRLPSEDDVQQPGYFVVYPDGYESWCPRDQFESANRRMDRMPFGHAIEAARLGFKIARAGWNGKNMFVFLREGRQITGVDPASPMGGDFESLPHFCMRTADGKCCVGWLASQTDMLADDWTI
jgi:hypothetical protein